MRLVPLILLVACSAPASQSPQTPTTPTSPTPTPTEPSPTTPVPPKPGMSETCGANDACADGLECVTYYGIAGPRGPEFKSCEIKCGDGQACPSGTTCITIADGPGQVCRPAQAEAPPFPAFGKRSTYYVLEVNAGAARCQPWTIDPDASRISTTRGELTDAFGFKTTDVTLQLFDREQTRGEDAVASTSCSETFLLRTSPEGLLVDGATWFSEQTACDAAVKQRRRAAMDFRCELALAPARDPKAIKATRTRFEGLLAKGGAFFSIVDGPKGQTCKRVKVVPHGKDKQLFEGNFTWPIKREEDGVKGTMQLGYSLGRGETKLWVTGPGATFADGSGFGFGCLGHTMVDYRADHVKLDDAAYFTDKACKAALAQRAATAAWMPPPPDDSTRVARTTESDPGIGGC